MLVALFLTAVAYLWIASEVRNDLRGDEGYWGAIILGVLWPLLAVLIVVLAIAALLFGWVPKLFGK